MQTATKGNATEAAVLNAFVARDLDVLVPFGGTQPYDLMVHLPGNLFLRVQCKTAREVSGCISFNSRTTDHGRGRLSYLGLADMFGVYFPPKDVVYLVPVRKATGFAVRLRLQPTRNNQKRGVRNAADYEFDRWTVDSLQRVARSEMAVVPSETKVA